MIQETLQPSQRARTVGETLLMDLADCTSGRARLEAIWDALNSFERSILSEHDTAEEIECLRAENARLSDVLDTERYKVALGVQKIARAVQGRRWLSQPGRGSYIYDDERYQAEFGAAIDEIEVALRPLMKIAQDWSDCPSDPLRVAANRSAALTSTKKEG